MDKKIGLFVVCGIALMMVVFALGYVYTNGGPNEQADEQPLSTVKASPDPDRVGRSSSAPHARVGPDKALAVEGHAQAKDVPVRPVVEKTANASGSEVPMRPAYGESPAVRADATNPQAAMVYKAMQPGSRDHRMLSILAAPKPFDEASFKRDPQPWLDRVEPARAWRPAQPGSDVPRLSRQSPAVVEIKQGETTALTVKSAPHAMVTFTSVDLGAFDNGLSAINVQADEQGFASATFHAVAGTLYDTDIQAASPMCSGVAKWVVHIIPTKRIPVVVEEISDPTLSQEQ